MKIVDTDRGDALIFFSEKITPKDKKYSVITPSRHLIHFGDRDYAQYKDNALGLYKKNDHNDLDRRKRYRIRHKKDKYDDPEMPSYYSWHYLW